MWQKFKDSYFLYSFRRDPVAVGSFLVLLILVAMAILAPFLATQNPYDGSVIDLMDAETPPMWTPEGLDTFWLGTDAQGRDIWSTILYGTRISLLIGLGAVALQSFLGIIIGLTAGYKGGRIDSFLMRVADVQLSFSSYMVAIFFGAILQAALGVARYADVAVPFLIFVIGFSEWPQYARTVRASVLAEKKKNMLKQHALSVFVLCVLCSVIFFLTP